jgi:hypothetical protein
MAGGAAPEADSTANPRPFRLRRASSRDVTGQARQIAAPGSFSSFVAGRSGGSAFGATVRRRTQIVSAGNATLRPCPILTPPSPGGTPYGAPQVNAEEEEEREE